MPLNLFYAVDQLSAWDPPHPTLLPRFLDKRFGKAKRSEGSRWLPEGRILYPWGVLDRFFSPREIGSRFNRKKNLNKIAADSDAKIIWQALEHFRPISIASGGGGLPAPYDQRTWPRISRRRIKNPGRSEESFKAPLMSIGFVGSLEPRSQRPEAEGL